MLTGKDLVEAHSFFEEKCPYSGTPIDDTNWHLEHIIPVVMGGTTDAWNCFPICSACNSSKGSKHLLDWWDENHGAEDEYLLEKIFEYIVKKLSEEREVKISSEEDIEKINSLIQESEENVENNNFFNKKLDTFTFMYQLLNHLNDSKQIDELKINEYKEVLNVAYIKNQQLERMDIEQYKNQMSLIRFLKEINVNNPYIIGINYSEKIKDLDKVKEKSNNINKILNINISEMINKNPDILLMEEAIFIYNFNYLKNVGINENVIINKPYLLNNITEAQELINACNKINLKVTDLSDDAFIKRKLFEIKEILSLEQWQDDRYKQLLLKPTVWRKDANQIKEILSLEQWQDDRYKPLLTPTVWLKDANQIKEILSLEEWQDDRYKPLLTSSVWQKDTNQIVKNIEICENNNLPVNIELVLKRSSNELSAIINFLNYHTIPLYDMNGKLNNLFSRMTSDKCKKITKELVGIESDKETLVKQYSSLNNAKGRI